MILKTLVELAQREGLVDDLDFEPKEVRWLIYLSHDGRFLGAIDTVEDVEGKGKLRAKILRIPATPPRANNPPPAFLVDTPEFVLGFDPSGKREQNVLDKRNLDFADYVARALSLAPDDQGLCATLAFLGDATQKTACVEYIKSRLKSGDKLAFRLAEDGTTVHERDAVRAAWKTIRSQGGEVRARCLSCGNMAVLVRLHPQIGFVPGAAKPIPFVSFNQNAFESFGLEGNDNAPVCQTCADSYGTALNRLFHPQYTDPKGRVLGRRSLRLSEDTAVVFWTSKQHPLEDDFAFIDDDDPAHVQTLLESVHKGSGAQLDDPTLFHALIVTGGQGRATLRGYHQTTIGALANSLEEYFRDIEIVRRFHKSPRWPPLSWLIRSLAVQGKFENVDPNLAGRLFLSILTGSIFPPAILQVALGRIRNEPEDTGRGRVKHSRERLALIRALLNRRIRSQDPILTSLNVIKEISVMLDPTCDNNAYCLGRLFAVLEKLQGEAIGNPGATITDRFYGAASATPVVVFGQLLRKAQHHLAKMNGPFYSMKIQEILNRLQPRDAFPPTLSLEEQGLFALGFYHQKADLWKGKESAPDAATPGTAD